MSVFRRLVTVSSLRRFDTPLYDNSLQLIRDEQLRGIVEQILVASSDRSIWADDMRATLRTRLLQQFDAAQLEVRNYVSLHPRAYVHEGSEPDAELMDLTRRRDEARRRLVNELKEELSEENMARVDAR